MKKAQGTFVPTSIYRVFRPDLTYFEDLRDQLKTSDQKVVYSWPPRSSKHVKSSRKTLQVSKKRYICLCTVHCGKKLGDVRIIHRTLCRSGFLLVTFYEFLVGQKKSTIGISSRCEKFVCLLVSAAYSIFGIFCFDQLKLGTSRNPDPCKILRMILPSPIFFTLCILGPHFLVSHENSKFWVT